MAPGLLKNGSQAIGRSRGGCTTKIHLVAAHARCALNFSLSPGQAGDAPAGRDLLRAGGPALGGCHLLMDRAYEGDETRDLAAQLGYIVVVPPNPNRLVPWEYDRVCIADAMKLNGCFAASKASATCFPTSTNSMSCLPPLSSLR
jgi:transposase